MPTIRAGTLADIPTLIALRSEFLAEMRARAHGSITSPANLEASTAEYFRRAIASGQYAAWLAEQGAEAIGMAGCFFFERPPMERPGAVLEGRVVNVYTRPAWRRQGLGEALVRAAVEHARALGARRLRLGAAPDGRGLYQRLGFQAVPNEMELRFLLPDPPASSAAGAPAPGRARPDAATSPAGE